MGFVPSVIALCAMAAVALVVTIVRGGLDADSAALGGAVRVAILTIACQVLHFAEETRGELNRRLPELFELEPVAMSSFVSLNLVAIAVFLLSVAALRAGVSAALFPLWFLAVASVFNALLHPALAFAAGGYFPGLFTSVVVGVAGLLLLRGLARITSGRASAGAIA